MSGTSRLGSPEEQFRLLLESVTDCPFFSCDESAPDLVARLLAAADV